MGDLVLHIGTEKTGTTTIQEFLRLNRHALMGSGIVVPGNLGRANHSVLPCIFYGDNRVDDISLMHRLDEPRFRLEKRELVLESLHESVRRYPDLKHIISSEHLQSRPIHADEIASLMRSLSGIFESIMILLYIRRPIETAVSSWSTGVKSGAVVTDLPPPSNSYIRNLCMHKETIQLWGGIFGMHRLEVRLFRSNAFVGGDLLQDFLSGCGISYRQDLVKPAPINEILSYNALKTLSEVNKIIPPLVDGKKNSARNGLVAFVQQYFDGCPPYYPTREDESLYNEYYSQSDEWVRSTLFPYLDSLWHNADNEVMNQRSRFSHTTLSKNAYQDLSCNDLSADQTHHLASLFAATWVNRYKRIEALEKDRAFMKKRLSRLRAKINACREKSKSRALSNAWNKVVGWIASW